MSKHIIESAESFNNFLERLVEKDGILDTKKNFFE